MRVPLKRRRRRSARTDRPYERAVRTDELSAHRGQGPADGGARVRRDH
ncbi:hypothetical protein BN2537_12449 [Streptomyces venezuelae]|nr:hypothetical protein BN2537_12449 [Streptomyces venezuelae]